jgi:hypothetical protein
MIIISELSPTVQRVSFWVQLKTRFILVTRGTAEKKVITFDNYENLEK